MMPYSQHLAPAIHELLAKTALGVYFTRIQQVAQSDRLSSPGIFFVTSRDRSLSRILYRGTKITLLSRDWCFFLCLLKTGKNRHVRLVPLSRGKAPPERPSASLGLVTERQAVRSGTAGRGRQPPRFESALGH